MSTATGKYAGYNVSELERLVLWEIGQVTGTTVSYSRYPRWLLRAKLNERQITAVKLSKCLRKLCLTPAQDGRRTYKLPENCMDGGLISAKYYTSASDYVDLIVRDTLWLDEHRYGWRTEQEADPEFIMVSPSYGNSQTFSVHPIPDTDGGSYTAALDTGVYLGASMPGTGSNLNGTCDSAGNSTTLNDSTTDFTKYGLVAGMAVRNLTDGSVAKLSTVADHQLVMSSALTGGSDNTFANADAYLILAGEYAVVTDIKNMDRYVFASEIGMLDNLTIPADTILIEFMPFPLAFPFDPETTDALQGYLNMYPELPKAYHHGLAMGVVADLLRTFNESSKEFQRAEAYENMFKSSALQAMEAKFARPFDDTGVRFSVRRK